MFACKGIRDKMGDLASPVITKRAVVALMDGYWQKLTEESATATSVTG